MTAQRLSLPKSKRLIRTGDFELVKKEGCAQKGKFLILGVAEKRSEFRAGFVTSKRVGGAVVRNRIRRRLREIVRQHQHEIVEPIWIVTIARPPAARATFHDLKDEWLRLAERASILAR
jgi:ribonuclease P protein component